MTDINKLREGLNKMRGVDLEEVDREERLTGATGFLDVTKSFQARLAARALGVNVHELKELPLLEYEEITTEVWLFLTRTARTS